jgi:hypothetical protein
MTEDNFDEFLKKTAQGYNVPPARTPRDDMWSAIQAQRAAGPRVVYGGGSLKPQSSERRFASRIWMGAAAAAVLLLATGVGLGRWSASSSARGVVAVPNPPAAVPAPNPVDGTSGSAAPNGTGAVVTNGTTIGGTEGARPPKGSLVAGGSRPPGAPGGNDAMVATTGPSISSSANAAANSAYQLTAVRHLSEAEALLTSFRTRSIADQQMDAQLGSWARQLLSNTRLLLDSPVANDPQRRPLLEDLELVLVQIVQLSPGSTPQDREMIEKTLQQDHVMTRLRTAIPAGSQHGS